MTGPFEVVDGPPEASASGLRSSDGKLRLACLAMQLLPHLEDLLGLVCTDQPACSLGEPAPDGIRT